MLPLFKARNKPFVLVFWSRDPDGTQHNQGDSLGQLTPGINGPTSLAAIKNADDDLARIRAALDELGLAATTDIIVSADHGFATIAKESKTSAAPRKAHYADVPEGLLPPGFVALDLAEALSAAALRSRTTRTRRSPPAHHPKRGNALIGNDPAHPDFVVAANGGSDLVYLPSGDRSSPARVVDALLEAGLCQRPLRRRRARQHPRHAAAERDRPERHRADAVAGDRRQFPLLLHRLRRADDVTVEIADTPLQQGQGMHGSFSRAETLNFMAAIGPDFKSRFVDPAPVSNADIGKTIAHVLGCRSRARDLWSAGWSARRSPTDRCRRLRLRPSALRR